MFSFVNTLSNFANQFLFFCGLTQKTENTTKLKKLFIWTTKSGGADTTNTQAAPDYSSATAILVIFGLNVISALPLIVRIHSTINLKANERVKNFFNPTNTQSSFEESLKEKRHAFIGMSSLFIWLNMQILNLCHRCHSVFTTLSNI